MLTISSHCLSVFLCCNLQIHIHTVSYIKCSFWAEDEEQWEKIEMLNENYKWTRTLRSVNFSFIRLWTMLNLTLFVSLKLLEIIFETIFPFKRINFTFYHELNQNQIWTLNRIVDIHSLNHTLNFYLMKSKFHFFSFTRQSFYNRIEGIYHHPCVICLERSLIYFILYCQSSLISLSLSLSFYISTFHLAKKKFIIIHFYFCIENVISWFRSHVVFSNGSFTFSLSPNVLNFVLCCYCCCWMCQK